MSSQNQFNFVQGPHHVGIVVKDFDASIKWYKEKIGFELISQTKNEEFGLKIGFIKSGKFSIELFESVNLKLMHESQQELMQSLGHQGYAHFAFATDNCDEAWERLQALGVELHLPPTTNSELGVRYCFIKDPDGILIEFIQDL